MPVRRLIAGLSAAVILVGVLVSASRGGVSSTAETLPPGRPAPAAKQAPLEGRMVVYTTGKFSPAEVAAIRRAASGATPTVALYEDYLASGNAHYPEIPVLTMVTEPEAYAAAVGDRALARALAKGAVLAKGEAALRRVGVGDLLRYSDGRTVAVTAVVDDVVLGGNEISLPRQVSRRRGTGVDYLLVSDAGNAVATERAVRAAVPRRKVRVVGETRSGFLNSADRVLTQLQVKQRFGEFALRRTGATSFEPDQAWVDRHLVNTRIQQLGRVTCHRAIVPALAAAMKEVTDRGLGSTIHTADFQYQGGCWHPNIIPGDSGTISRHSWGIAFDVNVDVNTFGEPARQDRRLLDILARHGFGWGGEWLTPDGMHFEATSRR